VGSHQSTRPLSPVEVAEAVQTAVDAGSSLRELAEFLHLEGTSVLTKFVRLLNLSPAVRHMVDWGKSDSTIGFTAASEVARLDDHDEQIQLCRAILQHRLGSTEMKQVLQLHNRFGKSLDDSIAEILKLRPNVERIHVYIGAVDSPELRKLLAGLTQAERDTALRDAIRRGYPALRKFGCRQGAERFTITGDEGVAAGLGGTEFETAINNALAEIVTP